MSSALPPTWISASAHVPPDAIVGPFCVVGAGVSLGPRCRLGAGCILEGPAQFGADNEFFPYVVLGTAPQDRSFAGEVTTLVVGDGNVFREHVTVHRGTAKDRAITRIGTGGFFLAGSHVAHDCVVGDRVILGNGTLLGGHVVVEDDVVTGGRVAIAPRVRIGTGAFLAAGAMIEQNMPPFVIAAGDRARVRALNRVGLERRAVPREHIHALEHAFRHLFRSEEPLAVARQTINRELAADPYVERLLSFWEDLRSFCHQGPCRFHVAHSQDRLISFSNFIFLEDRSP